MHMSLYGSGHTVFVERATEVVERHAALGVEAHVLRVVHADGQIALGVHRATVDAHSRPQRRAPRDLREVLLAFLPVHQERVAALDRTVNRGRRVHYTQTHIHINKYRSCAKQSNAYTELLMLMYYKHVDNIVYKCKDGTDEDVVGPVDLVEREGGPVTGAPEHHDQVVAALFVLLLLQSAERSPHSEADYRVVPRQEVEAHKVLLAAHSNISGRC